MICFFIFYVAGVDYKINCINEFCYISGRNICTVKVNIKETFMGSNGFLQTFICWMDCSQTIKDLLHNKFSIYWEKDKFLLLWENPGPMLSNNHWENIWDKLKFSCEISHYGKNSASVFQDIFISTNKTFNLGEQLCIKSIKLWGFPDIS